jgi:hypothetical protein
LWFTVAGFHEISLLLFISLLLGRLSRSSDFVFSWCCSVLQAAPVWKSFCFFSRELFCVLQVPVPNCPLSSRACATAPVSQFVWSPLIRRPDFVLQRLVVLIWIFDFCSPSFAAKQAVPSTTPSLL